MFPEGALLTIAANTVVVKSLTYATGYIPFERMEFDNTKLRDAKTANGERRVIIELLGGKSAQIVTSCASTTAVPLVPNTETVFNLVNKRFNFVRFSVTGDISEATAVNSLFTTAQAHQALLARFDAHIKRASGDISYEDLIAMQAETFSYLTTTSVTITGTAVDIAGSNVLITSMEVNNEASIPVDGFFKTYNLTLEIRTISNLSAP